jgi:hypothetical protein
VVVEDGLVMIDLRTEGTVVTSNRNGSANAADGGDDGAASD